MTINSRISCSQREERRFLFSLRARVGLFHFQFCKGKGDFVALWLLELIEWRGNKVVIDDSQLLASALQTLQIAGAVISYGIYC